MALPKGKLMALLAVFAAIGIITATGAFTSVTADRTATAEVVGDDSALLQLVGTSPYVSGSSSGALSIDFTNGSSTGLNPSATTTFEGLFEITNNGADSTNVSIAIDTSTVPAGSSASLIIDGTDQATTTYDFGEVSAGTQAGSVGLKFDMDEELEPSFDLTITIEADQESGHQG